MLLLVSWIVGITGPVWDCNPGFDYKPESISNTSLVVKMAMAFVFSKFVLKSTVKILRSGFALIREDSTILD